MKKIFAKIKPYLRWLVLGFTIFFLLTTLRSHWQQVTEVRITSQGWLWLSIALLVTFAAHFWSSWVWSWILRAFKLRLPVLWAIKVYLVTNIGKYLPGNIWHFYGRINAVVKAGGTVEVATITVLLEPLLMAAAALLMAIFTGSESWLWQLLGLVATLVGIHPLILNRVIALAAKAKGRSTSVKLHDYPWLLLGGEWVFLLLRGAGFLCAVAAFLPLRFSDLPLLLAVFSFAWLLGLVVPGAPGGLGVFEATVIASLNPQQFPPADILVIVALFRLVSILAEAIAALTAFLTLKDIRFS